MEQKFRATDQEHTSSRRNPLSLGAWRLPSRATCIKDPQRCSRASTCAHWQYRWRQFLHHLAARPGDYTIAGPFSSCLYLENEHHRLVARRQLPCSEHESQSPARTLRPSLSRPLVSCCIESPTYSSFTCA